MKGSSSKLLQIPCAMADSSSKLLQIKGKNGTRKKQPKKIQNLQRKKPNLNYNFWKVRCRKKVHAIVGQSTFPSQNVQSTACSDHFWKLRCRKRARGCGAKHISNPKCTKHRMFRPLLEVEMSKKCVRLWREADFHVESVKTSDLEQFLTFKVVLQVDPWMDGWTDGRMEGCKE